MTLLLSVLLFLGCATSNDRSSTPTFAQARGTEICEDLVSAYCDRCDETTMWSHETCLGRDEIDVDCDATINVGADHSECMEDIEDGTCGDPLPSTCNGVVIVHR